ncbi:mucin-5AC isoform X2 [Anopheles aquasalis]|uniref:mucin-5AC isoform X2 n=1 Tax=Anopheles aquasalis TaxID=42839 RepID=UPI00215B4A1D|nr:mucin-5AC isoform X2 [Anopheles aquasalis]
MSSDDKNQPEQQASETSARSKLVVKRFARTGSDSGNIADPIHTIVPNIYNNNNKGESNITDTANSADMRMKVTGEDGSRNGLPSAAAVAAAAAATAAAAPATARETPAAASTNRPATNTAVSILPVPNSSTSPGLSAALTASQQSSLNAPKTVCNAVVPLAQTITATITPKPAVPAAEGTRIVIKCPVPDAAGSQRSVTNTTPPIGAKSPVVLLSAISVPIETIAGGSMYSGFSNSAAVSRKSPASATPTTSTTEPSVKSNGAAAEARVAKPPTVAAKDGDEGNATECVAPHTVDDGSNNGQTNEKESNLSKVSREIKLLDMGSGSKFFVGYHLNETIRDGKIRTRRNSCSPAHVGSGSTTSPVTARGKPEVSKLASSGSGSESEMYSASTRQDFSVDTSAMNISVDSAVKVLAADVSITGGSAGTPVRRAGMRSENADFALKQQKFLNLRLHGSTGGLDGGDDEESSSVEGTSLTVTTGGNTGSGARTNKRNSGGGSGGSNVNPIVVSPNQSISTQVLPAEPTKPGSDRFCWKCRKSDSGMIACSSCPRSYHATCARFMIHSPNWRCAECVKVLSARSASISADKLHQCLELAIDRIISHPPCGSELFNPLQKDGLPGYTDYVSYHMDLAVLRDRTVAKEYSTLEGFLSDLSWILHNMLIYALSGINNNKMIKLAREICKQGRQQVEDIEYCSECYTNMTFHNNWFELACSKPHLLVWAKMKGYPYWPAKLFTHTRNNNLQMQVLFFGKHDRGSRITSKDCYLFSEQFPKQKPTKDKDWDYSMIEAKAHIEQLIERFGSFHYAEHLTTLDATRIEEQTRSMIPGAFGVGARNTNIQQGVSAASKNGESEVVAAVPAASNQDTSTPGKNKITMKISKNSVVSISALAEDVAPVTPQRTPMSNENKHPEKPKEQHDESGGGSETLSSTSSIHPQLAAKRTSQRKSRGFIEPIEKENESNPPGKAHVSVLSSLAKLRKRRMSVFVHDSPKPSQQQQPQQQPQQNDGKVGTLRIRRNSASWETEPSVKRNKSIVKGQESTPSQSGSESLSASKEARKAKKGAENEMLHSDETMAENTSNVTAVSTLAKDSVDKTTISGDVVSTETGKKTSVTENASTSSTSSSAVGQEVSQPAAVDEVQPDIATLSASEPIAPKLEPSSTRNASQSYPTLPNAPALSATEMAPRLKVKSVNSMLSSTVVDSVPSGEKTTTVQSTPSTPRSSRQSSPNTGPSTTVTAQSMQNRSPGSAINSQTSSPAGTRTVGLLASDATLVKQEPMDVNEDRSSVMPAVPSQPVIPVINPMGVDLESSNSATLKRLTDRINAQGTLTITATNEPLHPAIPSSSYLDKARKTSARQQQHQKNQQQQVVLVEMLPQSAMGSGVTMDNNLQKPVVSVPRARKTFPSTPNRQGGNNAGISGTGDADSSSKAIPHMVNIPNQQAPTCSLNIPVVTVANGGTVTAAIVSAAPLPPLPPLLLAHNRQAQQTPPVSSSRQIPLDNSLASISSSFIPDASGSDSIEGIPSQTASLDQSLNSLLSSLGTEVHATSTSSTNSESGFSSVNHAISRPVLTPEGNNDNNDVASGSVGKSIHRNLPLPPLQPRPTSTLAASSTAAIPLTASHSVEDDIIVQSAAKMNEFFENVLSSVLKHAAGQNTNWAEVVQLKHELARTKEKHRVEMERLRNEHARELMDVRKKCEQDRAQALRNLLMQANCERELEVMQTKRMRWCNNCLKEAPFTCCSNASYCSAECHQKDWPSHQNSHQSSSSSFGDGTAGTIMTSSNSSVSTTVVSAPLASTDVDTTARASLLRKRPAPQIVSVACASMASSTPPKTAATARLIPSGTFAGSITYPRTPQIAAVHSNVTDLNGQIENTASAFSVSSTPSARAAFSNLVGRRKSLHQQPVNQSQDDSDDVIFCSSTPAPLPPQPLSGQRNANLNNRQKRTVNKQGTRIVIPAAGGSDPILIPGTSFITTVNPTITTTTATPFTFLTTKRTTNLPLPSVWNQLFLQSTAVAASPPTMTKKHLPATAAATIITTATTTAAPSR